MSAKYSNVTAEIADVKVEGLDAIVEGSLWFVLAPGVTPQDVCEEIRKRGKQMGILIKSTQHIRSAHFRSGDRWVEYQPNDTVARACAIGFGEASGDQWVGFSLNPGVEITPEVPEAGRMGYGLRFTLHNFRTRLQVIPIVHACLDLPIARLHVISVHVVRALSDDPTQARSIVAATVDSTREQRS